MKLDVTINVLRRYNEEDGKYCLVAGFESIVQQFPVKLAESRARLSILEEINSAIADKINEINSRLSASSQETT